MKTIKINSICFSIKPNDEKGKYTIEEAKLLCNNLKDGWRIPSSDELLSIYNEIKQEGKDKLTKKWKFKIKNTNYLTINQTIEGWPISFDFNDGSNNISDENFKHHLRLIR